MNIQQRVIAAIEHSGLTQERIAERVRKIPGGEKFIQQNLSSMANGRTTSSTYIAHIAAACRVNPIWLAAGVGEMALTANNVVPLRVGEPSAIYDTNPAFTDNTKDITAEFIDEYMQDIFKKMDTRKQIDTIINLLTALKDPGMRQVSPATILKLISMAG